MQLHRVLDPDYIEEDVGSFLVDFFKLDWFDMHVFGRGVAHLFKTPEGVKSTQGKQTLQAAYESHRVCTDWAERSHALINASAPAKAIRAFHYYSIGSVIQQSRVCHMHNNGMDPAKPLSINAAVEKSELNVPPLF